MNGVRGREGGGRSSVLVFTNPLSNLYIILNIVPHSCLSNTKPVTLKWISGQKNSLFGTKGPLARWEIICHSKIELFQSFFSFILQFWCTRWENAFPIIRPKHEQNASKAERFLGRENRLKDPKLDCKSVLHPEQTDYFSAPGNVWAASRHDIAGLEESTVGWSDKNCLPLSKNRSSRCCAECRSGIQDRKKTHHSRQHGWETEFWRRPSELWGNFQWIRVETLHDSARSTPICKPVFCRLWSHFWSYPQMWNNRRNPTRWLIKKEFRLNIFVSEVIFYILVKLFFTYSSLQTGLTLKWFPLLLLFKCAFQLFKSFQDRFIFSTCTFLGAAISRWEQILTSSACKDGKLTAGSFYFHQCWMRRCLPEQILSKFADLCSKNTQRGVIMFFGHICVHHWGCAWVSQRIISNAWLFGVSFAKGSRCNPHPAPPQPMCVGGGGGVLHKKTGH